MSVPALRSAIAWFAAATAIAVGLGLASALVQQYFAPLGLYPVLVGLVLGVALVAALRLTQFGNRRWAIVGTVAAAAVLMVAQFYGSYRLYVAAVEAKAPPSMSRLPLDRLQPPDNLWAYLRQQAQHGRPLFAGLTARGGWAWATWVCDWVLAAGAALVAVRQGFRRPWCAKCHKWYRAVGEGELSRETTGRIGKLAEVTLPKAGGRYRVWACPTAGHGTAIEIAWTLPATRPAQAGKKAPSGQSGSGQSEGNQHPAVTLIDIPPAKAAALQAILAEQAGGY